MMRRIFLGCLAACFCGVTGFSQAVVSEVAFEATPVDPSVETDAGMEAFLKPYRAGVEAYASEVVGYAAETLNRTQPECGLSNWAADSLKYMGEIEFGTEVDLAVSNFGGLRRDLPAGPLTMGHLLELSPFDNYLTYMEVKGELVVELARQVAGSGSVALSGMSVVVNSDQEVMEARVNGELIDADRNYKLVTIDYLATTWTDLFREEWIVEERVLDDVIQRDAMIALLKKMTEAGEELHDAPEGRVYFQE